MDLKALQKRTVDLESKFSHRFDKTGTMLDLVEEVGELAQAMLIVEGIKKTTDPAKQRSIEDVANALGDVLFDLLALADKYDLDMETEYEKVLVELQNRYEIGEFDTK